MGKRQREWARKTRDKLLTLLGNKCAKCSTTSELELDVIFPIADNDKHHRKMDWSWRMSFYRKQYERGNLQVLCKKHNVSKSNKPELTSSPEIEQPF